MTRVTFRPWLSLTTQTISTCHRLDKDTSGAVLMAKNDEAYRHASIQFEDRKIEKIYHAVVEGLHVFENVKVGLPISPTSKGVVRIDYRKGKESTTYLNCIETLNIIL